MQKLLQVQADCQMKMSLCRHSKLSHIELEELIKRGHFARRFPARAHHPQTSQIAPDTGPSSQRINTQIVLITVVLLERRIFTMAMQQYRVSSTDDNEPGDTFSVATGDS